MEQQSSFQEKVSIMEQPYAYTYLCPAVASLIRCNFLLNKKQGAIQDGSLQGEVVIQDEKGQKGIRALRIDNSNNVLDGKVAFPANFFKALDFLMMNYAIAGNTDMGDSTEITLNTKDFGSLLYGSEDACAGYEYNYAKRVLLNGLRLLEAVSFDYNNARNELQIVRIVDSVGEKFRSEIIKVALNPWFCQQLRDRPKKILLPLILFQNNYETPCYFNVGRKLAEHACDIGLQHRGLSNIIRVGTLCRQYPTLAVDEVRGSKKGLFIRKLYEPLTRAFREFAYNDITNTAPVFVDDKNQVVGEEKIMSMGQGRFLELYVKYTMRDIPFGTTRVKPRFD